MTTMVELICPRCGWKWETESLAWKLSCPFCGKKVDNVNINKREVKTNV